jgi:hypothetical protein
MRAGTCLVAGFTAAPGAATRSRRVRGDEVPYPVKLGAITIGAGAAVNVTVISPSRLDAAGAGATRHVAEEEPVAAAASRRVRRVGTAAADHGAACAPTAGHARIGAVVGPIAGRVAAPDTPSRRCPHHRLLRTRVDRCCYGSVMNHHPHCQRRRRGRRYRHRNRRCHRHPGRRPHRDSPPAA